MAVKRRSAAGDVVTQVANLKTVATQRLRAELRTTPFGAGRREASHIYEYLNLRYGVRLELLDVLVEEQWPRAVLLVALEARSCPYLHTELEERAPLVQGDARRGGRLEEL